MSAKHRRNFCIGLVVLIQCVLVAVWMYLGSGVRAQEIPVIRIEPMTATPMLIQPLALTGTQAVGVTVTQMPTATYTWMPDALTTTTITHEPTFAAPTATLSPTPIQIPALTNTAIAEITPVWIVPEATATLTAPAMQQAGVVMGSAFTMPHETQSGVLVTLSNETGSYAAVYTAEDGSYVFTGVSPGWNTITASRHGYLSVSISFEVSPNSTLTLEPLMLLAGDLNGDGVIDDTDINLLTSFYDVPAGAVSPGMDFDHDALIGLGDLYILAQHLGSGSPP